MKARTLANILESYRLAVVNSRDPEIEAALTGFGLTTEYLQEGVDLYSETMTLVQDQNREKQEEAEAYDTYFAAQEAVQDTVTKTIKIVRLMAKEDQNLIDRLRIPDSYPGAIAQWIEAVTTFYNNLLNETAFVTSLAPFGKTTETLTAERDAVIALKDLRNKAQVEKGESQEATRQRNLKLDELKAHVTQLKGLATLALADKPQLLEKMGVLVR